MAATQIAQAEHDQKNDLRSKRLTQIICEPPLANRIDGGAVVPPIFLGCHVESARSRIQYSYNVSSGVTLYTKVFDALDDVDHIICVFGHVHWLACSRHTILE